MLGSLQDTYESLFERGNKHFAAQQYQDAVKCYNKALSLLADNSQQQQQQQQPHSCQLLLSVLLNMAATCLQLQQPVQALLYATAAASVSCHKSSKAFYRAAVALDHLVGQEKAGGGVGSSSSASNIISESFKPRKLAKAATSLMQTAVQLAGGLANAEAAAKMMGALTHSNTLKPASSTSKSGKTNVKPSSSGGNSSSSTTSSSSSEAADAGWGTVVAVLAAAAKELQACFADGSTATPQQVDLATATPEGRSTTSSSSNTTSSSTGKGSAATSAAQHKEVGNAAFIRQDYSGARKSYQAAFTELTRSRQHPAATILSNRAACWLQLSGPDLEHMHQQAFLDALAAALLDPTQVWPFAASLCV